MSAGASVGHRPPEEAIVILLPALGILPPGAAALISALCADERRLSVVLVAARPDVASVAGRFPAACTVVAGPLLSHARLRTRAILCIEPASALPAAARRFLARAHRRDIPAFSLTEAGALALAESRQAEWPLAPLGRAAVEGLPACADLAATVDHLVAAMGFERGERPIVSRMARIAQRLLSGPYQPLVSPAIHKLADRKELTSALGRPQTIMCLGNGPTSADPRLAGMAHDALFRVNHQWQAGGYLTGADVIFAGVKKSMRAAGSTLIGVASHRKEEALLGTRLTSPWNGALRYFVVEEIAGIASDALNGHPRPTTGAVMLAAAIALAPRRLIVAGMDMFADPAGAYPGQNTVNAYTAAHDRNTDAEFIRTHLRRYEGEIVTLSAAFAEVAQKVEDGHFILIDPAHC